MHSRRLIERTLFAVLFGLAVIGARCEAPELLPPDRNRPPETFLTSGPDSADLTYFRVHFYWSGFDPDGTVSQWQYAIDDTVIRPEAEIVGTGWIPITKTDSVFVLSASVNGTDQQRDHRFFIASIDNEGKIDPTPSVRDFSARTICYPVPDVLSGPAEGETLDVFSSVTLCWGGTDCDGRIVSMDFALLPFEGGFSSAPLEVQNCATFENLPSNRSREAYRFLLIATDDAGSRNISAVERRFVVNHDPNTEITRFFSVHSSGDPNLFDLNVTPGDTIADSSRVTFNWEATDVDGAIKGSFWQVDGLNFFADTSLASDAETRQATVQWLTSDNGGARLIVGTFDEYGRAEGSPDTIPFFVNFPPTVAITKPAQSLVNSPDGRLTVGWRGTDRDGPRSAIAYIVSIKPRGSSPTSVLVDAGRADSTVFEGQTSGEYLITVEPTDRRRTGKTGPTAELSIFLQTSAEAEAHPARAETPTRAPEGVDSP